MIDGSSDAAGERTTKVVSTIPKAKDIASKCRQSGAEHLPRRWMMRAVFVGGSESSAHNYTACPTDYTTASYV